MACFPSLASSLTPPCPHCSQRVVTLIPGPLVRLEPLRELPTPARSEQALRMSGRLTHAVPAHSLSTHIRHPPASHHIPRLTFPCLGPSDTGPALLFSLRCLSTPGSGAVTLSSPHAPQSASPATLSSPSRGGHRSSPDGSPSAPHSVWGGGGIMSGGTPAGRCGERGRDQRGAPPPGTALGAQRVWTSRALLNPGERLFSA